MAVFIPVFSIGLSPTPTLLDVRIGHPKVIPNEMVAGDFLLFKFRSPKNIFIDGKRGSALPGGYVLLAPDIESFGSATNIYYRRYKNGKLIWWSKKVPVNFTRPSETIRLPASIPVTSTEDYNSTLLMKAKPLKESLISGCFARPLRSTLTANFGEPRILPNGHFYRHNGIDQRAWTGVPIDAISDGIVTFADELDITGRVVVIDHGAGLSSRYMHLSKFLTVSGAKVKKGQVIGLSGSSGRASAPHLHWEVSWKGFPLDPVRFLQKMEPICDLM